MAKKNKKLVTFKQRLQAWAENRDEAVQDTVLTAAALFAWQLYVDRWPRTASLVVSSALTLHRLYNIDYSVLDAAALAEKLEIAQLEEAILIALMAVQKPNLAWLLLLKLKNVNVDVVTVPLGLILLLHSLRDTKYEFDAAAEVLDALPKYFDKQAKDLI